ncbi:MAG TPA: M14 family metallopeptidase [Gemmatimonadota bacterium]|nr:M14 family metallopeptidase [Gemmatimonadota bacterium]
MTYTSSDAEERSHLVEPPAGGRGSMRATAVVVSLATLLATTSMSGQEPPGERPAVRPQTRAERSGYHETSRYADVIAFLDSLESGSPGLQVLSFGYTQEGRSLPLVVWDPGSEAGPASDEVLRARGGDRVRALVLANIHAGEVEGKEASLILLRELAAGAHPEWGDSLVLFFVPIYNADGNERVTLDNRPLQNGPIGGMGQRPNARGYDLNRDFMKLDTPEARSLVGLLRDVDPHVVIDLHTTNGTLHAYHLTYAPPLHPDSDPEIDDFLRSTWLPEVTARMAEGKPAWLAYYYGNLPDAGVDGADDATVPRAWYTFDHRPRFSTNYIGLRNRFGILSEAFAYLRFQVRVEVTKRFVVENLDYAWRHAGEIRRIAAAADARSLVGTRLGLRAEHALTGEDVEILLGEVEEERHPYTGEVVFRRRDVVRAERMPEYGAFRATETERVPAAYLIPADLDEVLDHLVVHGIRAEPLGSDRELEVEVFRIAASRQAEQEFQGHRERTLDGAWSAVRRRVPAGTAVLPMDQPLARLAFLLLEPRSDDGLAAWNVLDPALEDADEYPIMRTSADPR